MNIKDKNDDTGFIWACENQPELAKMMLEKDNIDFNIQDNLDMMGFMMACVMDSELLKKMLENNQIDKNLKNEKSLTSYDIAQKKNPKSFDIYEIWMIKQEKNHINSQVQKRINKPNQHL